MLLQVEEDRAGAKTVVEYHVEFRHIHSNSHRGREALGPAQGGLHGITIATVSGQDRTAIGVAVCSASENFSRRAGRDRALRDALGLERDQIDAIRQQDTVRREAEKARRIAGGERKEAIDEDTLPPWTPLGRGPFKPHSQAIFGAYGQQEADNDARRAQHRTIAQLKKALERQERALKPSQQARVRAEQRAKVKAERRAKLSASSG
jgi:hypothetical protein